jgi:carboxypeptidase Taq
MNALTNLKKRSRQITALGQVSGLLGWDQETMMSPGSADQRSEVMGAMEATLHALKTDTELGDLIAEVGQLELSQADARHVTLLARSVDRATKVPADLAEVLAKTTSRGQGVWAQARGADDFAAFAPTLKDILALKREEAAALSSGDTYNALLDDFEPGGTRAQLDAMFGAMRPRLVALRDKILGSSVNPAEVTGTFPRAQQIEVATKLASDFGYDYNRGRLDFSVHPFSSGSGDDARITTRVSESDPFNCFYSTIHEVGHATYEQNVRSDYALTPLGQGVSMGVHESQSRIYENQMGRSRAFTGHLFGQMKTHFNDFGIDDAVAFYSTVNAVRNGFIRTEADEVQYNLHILLRYDLEQALVSGDLAVDDLEAAWNDRFKADFGFAVDKASNGVLQDVHWSVGLFGYFPTYSLGNVYAGCLHTALRKDLLDLDVAMAGGDTSAATSWLANKVQRFGGLYEPADVITRACGEAPTEAPLLDYLDAKFGEIYKL